MDDNITTAMSAGDDSQESPTNVLPIASNIGQSGERRPAFLVGFGRGNSGKSTGLRWVGERSLGEGRAVAIGDCDRNNQTLTAFFGDQIERPEQPDDDLVVAWLNEAVDVSVNAKASLVLDMGGGDLVLPRYASSMQLVSFLEEQGVRPVALHFTGPALDDLSTLQDIEELGAFCPAATVIVLNAGLIRDTRAADVAFKAVRAHPAFETAVARGARVVVMPKLACMHEIDRRRLMFADAQHGKVKPGQTPLGPTMRQMVAIWRRSMEAAFAPVAEWLP